jgi:hypothetical protein
VNAGAGAKPATVHLVPLGYPLRCRCWTAPNLNYSKRATTELAELHATLLVSHWEMTMSLRDDIAVFREPGFHVSALFTVLSLAGLLVFCGLALS